MPCHEHGVGLDGSHVKSSGEEAFEAASTPDRRERRACPSEESETTTMASLARTQKNEQKNRGREGQKWLLLAIDGQETYCSRWLK